MRRVALILAAAGVLLLGSAGAALAADETEVDPTITCDAASDALVKAKDDLAAAVQAALALGGLTEEKLTQAEIDRLAKIVDGPDAALAADKARAIGLVLDLRVALGEADAAQTDACKLPAEQSTTTTPATAPGDDVDCADVPQAEAQAILDRDPTDPNRLDADGDGVACEIEGSTGAEPSATVSGGQVARIPVGYADTGDGSSL